MIPGAFWIDNRHRATEADAQAIRFGAEDFRVFATGKAEFFETGFEKLPRSEAGLRGAAFRLGLIGTQEDVAFDFPDAQGVCAAMEIFHLRWMIVIFRAVANLISVWSLTLVISSYAGPDVVTPLVSIVFSASIITAMCEIVYG